MTAASADVHPRAADTRLESAFAAEENNSLRMVMNVRIAVSFAIIVFLMITFPNAGGLYWALMTSLFGILGVLQYLVARSRFHATWHKYAWVFLDLALVSFIILGGNAWLPEQFPLSQRLRYPNFDYLYVVIAALALSYTPWAVAWAGVSGVICWGAGVLWIISQPEIMTEFTYPNFRSLPAEERTKVSNGLYFVDISARIQEFFILLLFAGALAASVWRSRAVIRRQVVAERARTHLSRYFSPAIVDEILEDDAAVSAGRTQKAAVLFADIVGFTRMAENLPPEDVMTLLREFHGRMGRVIFEHQGSIDKYIGDAVMATFGTPRPGDDDAGHAIGCAAAMQQAIADWNGERSLVGLPPVDVGVGVDYGDVVIGNMGDERRLEFAVIGDTVNVAARLQTLTRERDEAILLSGDTVAAAGSPERARQIGTTPIRGREGEVGLWTLT